VDEGQDGPRPTFYARTDHSLIARIAVVVPWADVAIRPCAGVGLAYISAASFVHAASYPRMLLGQCRAGDEADPDNEAANECAHLISPRRGSSSVRKGSVNDRNVQSYVAGGS
jgi:hypothetical protein